MNKTVNKAVSGGLSTSVLDITWAIAVSFQNNLFIFLDLMIFLTKFLYVILQMHSN